MKKIIFIFSLIFIYSCTAVTSDAEEEDLPSAEDRVVRMEFLTTQPNFDEIRVSYYDYKTDTYPLVVHQFSYDSSGDPIPFIITLENYNFRYIDGEGYRNNPSAAEISVKLYVNDELVDEDVGKGVNGEYAQISFSYDAGY